MNLIKENHGHTDFRKRAVRTTPREGLFDTTLTLVQTHHGTQERCTTKVTGKGQAYFVNGFLNGRFAV
ncbi:MAG: hypothetical protein ACI378_06075 [Bacteroides sp.]